eukprot:TRINITY_DN4576_c0_g2_i4.p1 TRINITY_DN4576_c0_g2~~TRINITY_DN4576_c0_g2_i4.p1  ORF type:complete len:447 (-),score=71.97 TRINITY_DN4576_c0_g2_i4:361-1701(-)
MAKYLREKVSKNKNRFKQDGFDLDLTYITDRIIAMGFPSSQSEAVYRNPLPEVQKFFEHYHKDQYKLYNLCAERKYEESKFQNRVAQYPFYDHNAPPIELIALCCADIHDWLIQSKDHVVGINCKAGKGRTGLIICCYLMHAGIRTTTESALEFYGSRRTKDGKGVTIASQQRYIRYYETVLTTYYGVIPRVPVLYFEKIIIHTIPKIHGAFHVEVRNNDSTYRSCDVVPSKSTGVFEIPMEGASISGDCNVQLWLKKAIGGELELCHFWFNTGFHYNEMYLKLDKPTIDVANKDKRNKVFREDFAIEAFFKSADPGRVRTISSNSTSSSTVATTPTLSISKQTFTSSSSTGKSVTFMAARPTGSDRRSLLQVNVRGESEATSENDGSNSSSPLQGEEKKEKDGGSDDGKCITRERNMSFYGYAMHSVLIDAGVSYSSDADDEDDE